jgi:hypothetical protein
MWHRLSFQFSWFLVGVLFLKHDRSAKEVGRDYTINEKIQNHIKLEERDEVIRLL